MKNTTTYQAHERDLKGPSFDYTKPKKPLTSKQYIKQGAGMCPFCKSGDISGDGVEVNETEAYQKVYCCGCGAVWQDIYKLAAMVVLEEPTASYPA